MGIFDAIILGIIEGITEFLPVSSTAHLTIAEKLLGYSINDADITAFTAIIQIGAIFATLLYFKKDIWQIVTGWISGIINGDKRSTQEYRFGWAVIIGSIPIGIIGLLFKDQIEHNLRSLWLVGIALIAWSAVMWLADKAAKQSRHEADVTWKDTLFIGAAQCLALVPGVSRSGATMSAGLFRDLDRVTVTRLSFFLSIPALLAAGMLETVSKYSDISSGVGWTATAIATITSFGVAYLSIAWLLKYVAKHTYSVFIVYRLIIGTALLVLLASGIVAST